MIALVLGLAVLHMVPRLLDRTYTVTTTGHHTTTSPLLVITSYYQALGFVNLKVLKNMITRSSESDGRSDVTDRFRRP